MPALSPSFYEVVEVESLLDWIVIRFSEFDGLSLVACRPNYAFNTNPGQSRPGVENFFMQADGKSLGYSLGFLLAHNPEVPSPHFSPHNRSQVFWNGHLESVARAMPQQIIT